MGRQVHYGKPRTFPFLFKAGNRNYGTLFVSGTFRTRKAAEKAAQDYSSRTGTSYFIVDRRATKRRR